MSVKQLREAVQLFIDETIATAASGDAGYWDPEQQETVIQGRAALAEDIKNMQTALHAIQHIKDYLSNKDHIPFPNGAVKIIENYILGPKEPDKYKHKEFEAWWKENQDCPDHTLTIQNCAFAAWCAAVELKGKE